MRLTRGELLAGAAGLVLARPVLAATDARVQRFVSRPDLVPPSLDVRGRTSDYVFLAPSSGPGQRGAMIVDGRGALVWFHEPAHNVHVLRAWLDWYDAHGPAAASGHTSTRR